MRVLRPQTQSQRPTWSWWATTILIGGISGAVVSIITLNAHQQGFTSIGASIQTKETTGLRADSNLNAYVPRSESAAEAQPKKYKAKPRIGSEDDTQVPTYAPTIHRSPSPYETYHPGRTLPWWAKKDPHIRSFVPPRGNKICYAHVGKTAGSSIGCALGFRLHCDGVVKGVMPYLPGRLPKSTTHLFHQAVYDCPLDTDYYLFIVRDPLARSRSAFVYGRPLDAQGHNPHEHKYEDLKKLYVDCNYQTMNDLARHGLGTEGHASDTCKQRARDMLRGTGRYESHHFFNYQYYNDAIPKDAKIMVIRTEHMAEDWLDLEVGLGGKNYTSISFPRENSQPKQERDLILGDSERMLLCHELCAEIQVYKSLLQRAINIKDDQYETSMKELRATCPNEADIERCSFDPPDISRKIDDFRGDVPF
mmetsp:Transcript_3868/g.8577  ORF Transcript_3868/g.8577 Transcript_3868/m.8577 type:complete len:421 (-) Transcript_3868:355-1617(-)